MRIGMSAPWASPFPSGRGCEAMTYGRARFSSRDRNSCGADVSHLAELVRGKFLRAEERPPHPALRATFSPRGEGAFLAGIAP